jgi:arylsulfatase A-like enzyme
MAGGELPSSRTIDGHDISPLLYGAPGATTPYEAFYYYQADQLQAVRSGPWKLFLPVEAARHPHFKKGQPPQLLLFNVVEDVGSEYNVAAEQPEVVARLLQLAQSARQELGDRGQVGRGQRERGALAAGAKPQPWLLAP